MAELNKVALGVSRMWDPHSRDEETTSVKAFFEHNEPTTPKKQKPHQNLPGVYCFPFLPKDAVCYQN